MACLARDGIEMTLGLTYFFQPLCVKWPIIPVWSGHYRLDATMCLRLCYGPQTINGDAMWNMPSIWTGQWFVSDQFFPILYIKVDS